MIAKFKLRRQTEEQTSLFVEFKIKGQKIVIFPGKVVQTEFWDSTNFICKKKHPNAEEMNLFLKTWKDDLEKIVLNLETKKQFINKQTIEEELEKLKPVAPNEDENGITDFISFMQFYINKRRDKKPNLQRLNQNKKNVIVAFNLITKKKLAEWNKLGSKQKSKIDLTADSKLDFKDINYKFIEKFREYLYTAKFRTTIKGVEVEQNYKINYIDKQIKTLKQFLLSAIKEKYVNHFTWDDDKSLKKDVDSVYTNFEEIQQLFDTPLTHKTEILVRDKYVLNCFLGMRYSDLNKLAAHQFTREDEEVILEFRQKKTDDLVIFSVHPSALGA